MLAWSCKAESSTWEELQPCVDRTLGSKEQGVPSWMLESWHTSVGAGAASGDFG